MAVTGYKAPGTAASVDRDAKALWANVNNAKVNDANYAQCIVGKGTYSDWLRLTNFDFSEIPAGATIDGLEVQILKQQPLPEHSDINDSVVRLRDSGGQTGDNKASAVDWPSAKGTFLYGTAIDDWNAGLSAADVKASTFGIDISALNTDSGSNQYANVYFCQIRIYYTVAGIDHEKSLSDTVTISDSIVKAVGLNKSDSAAISDAIVKSVGLFKADSVAIADSITKRMGIIKADTIAIADTIVKAVSLGKADTVTIADAIAKIISLAKAESVIIADSISKAISLVKADTVTIGDSISKAILIVKTDVMAIADTMTHIGLGKFINLFDTVTITDSLVGVLRVKTYLKQAIDRMGVKGLDAAKMSVKRMGIAQMSIKGIDIAQMQAKGIDIARIQTKRIGIAKTALFRWIIRRWTA